MGYRERGWVTREGRLRANPGTLCRRLLSNPPGADDQGGESKMPPDLGKMPHALVPIGNPAGKGPCKKLPNASRVTTTNVFFCFSLCSLLVSLNQLQNRNLHYRNGC